MATFGISIVSPAGSIVESIDVEMKGEFKQLINSVGQHSEAKTYDTSYAVSVRAKGIRVLLMLVTPLLESLEFLEKDFGPRQLWIPKTTTSVDGLQPARFTKTQPNQ